MLQKLIETNRANQARARELNVRSGTGIFPVLDREALQVWLMLRLNGARSVAEIGDLSSLLLPPLDPELEAAVLRDNPDTVSLLGEESQVEYRRDRAPRVILTLDPAANRRWLRLPTELKLPGGRAVEMGVKTLYGYDPLSVSTDGAEVVEKVRSHLNRDQWGQWLRPQLALPSETDPAAEVPPIITAEYGRCLMDDTPLLAYGVVACKNYYSYSGGALEPRWLQSRAEAEELRAASVAKLVELQAEAILMASETAIREEAEAAKEELAALRSLTGFWDMDPEVRRQVDEWGYNRPYDLGPLQAWTAETKALIVKVTPALAEISRARAEAEAAEADELAPILRWAGKADAWGNPLVLSIDQARGIYGFAVACLRAVNGDSQAAFRALDNELRANYGRARRQEAIQNRFPGLAQTEAGGRFMSLSRAEEVDVWLAGAGAWLMAKTAPVAQRKAVPTPVPAAPTTPKAEAQPQTGGLNLSGLAGKFSVRKK